MMSHAKLSIHLPSRHLANSIAKALQPELDQTGARASVSLRLHDKNIELKFHARDTTTLRAIMNSYIRMISACTRVAKTIDELKG